MFRRLALIVALSGILACVLRSSPAQAQGPQPLGSPPALLPGQAVVTGPKGVQAIVESDARLFAPRQVAGTGGPDQFGYTWDNSAPFSWIDATGGSNTGLNGTYQYAGPISLPFAFKYYENIYSQLYISTHGIVGFNSQVGLRGQQSAIPEAGAPNDVIAPYWAPEDASTGGIYYTQGGSAPNRYFVVEWNQVRDYTAGSRLTFEVILYENSDILFQYQSISLGSSRWARSSGIEDFYGLDGLKYSNNVPANNTAVLFARPSAAARAFATPLNNGRFTTLGATESFTVTIRNTGEFGNDTFDLIPSSPWTVSVFSADGVTPLSDTNASGYADTGSLAPSAGRTIVVRIQTPSTLNVGDASNATLLIRSSVDTSQTRSVRLSTASPAPFAAVYSDRANYAMSLYLSHPLMQTVRKATGDNYYASSPSILELPAGNFLYAWQKFYCIGSNCDVQGYYLEYMLLDHTGNSIKAITQLTHPNTSLSTSDVSPALAALPNGRIGIFWYQYVYDASYNYVYNLFFAVLDANGNLVVGPLNLTNNSNLNAPQFFSPRLASTTDNRFVLGWARYESGATNVWYAVRDSDGNSVQNAGQLTTAGNVYYFQSLNRATGNNALFTWMSPWDIHFAAVDSSGNTVRGDTNLTNNGSGRYSSDAALLSDGRIAIAWTNYDGAYPGLDQMAFAILGSDYNLLSGPTALDNPAAVNGNNYVSVAADQSGHAILTWLDETNQFHIYYALISTNGSILTQPMVLHASESIYQLYLNYDTDGLTSNTQPFTTQQVDLQTSGPVLAGGGPGGLASVQLSANNSGLSPSGSIMVTATLDSNLSFVSANPPPLSLTRSPVRPLDQTVRWQLPNLDFLGVTRIALNVGVPNASIGTQYPITWSLQPSNVEAHPADNNSITNVFVALQNFLPVVAR